MRDRFPKFLGLALIVGLLFACGGSGGDTTYDPGGSACNPPTIAPPANEGAAVGAASYTYCLNYLNQVRLADNGALTPFTRTSELDAFAQNAARDLLITGTAHQYFSAYNPSCCSPGFNTMCAENQGYAGFGANADTFIQNMIDGMMAEKTLYPVGHPDRGHYETIVNPGLTKVGIGLVWRNDGMLYLSNDFSN